MVSKVAEQVANVASLPGIVDASHDAGRALGPAPIGGVAAFDADRAAWCRRAVSASTSPGVHAAHRPQAVIWKASKAAADVLFAHIPAGVGSTGALHMGPEMDAMLRGGARWAVRATAADRPAAHRTAAW